MKRKLSLFLLLIVFGIIRLYSAVPFITTPTSPEPETLFDMLLKEDSVIRGPVRIFTAYLYDWYEVHKTGNNTGEKPVIGGKLEIIYNKAGHRKVKKMYVDNDLIETTKYSYQMGLLKKITVFDEHSELKSIIRIMYNKDNNPVSALKYNKNRKETGSIYCTYDNSHRLIKVITNTFKSDYDQKDVTYEYNENGLLGNFFTVYKNEQDNTRRKTYSYDEHGRYILFEENHIDGQTDDYYKSVMVHDDKGLRISSSFYASTKDTRYKLELRSSSMYYYDEKNRLINYRLQSETKPEHDSYQDEMVYEYDEYGNFVLWQNIYSREKDNTKTVRETRYEYEYF